MEEVNEECAVIKCMDLKHFFVVLTLSLLLPEM
jgi:hypothetical protein